MSGIFVAAARHQDCAIPTQSRKMEICGSTCHESKSKFGPDRCNCLQYCHTLSSLLGFFFELRNTSKKLGSLALPSFAQNLDFGSCSAASRHEIYIIHFYQKPGNYPFFGFYRSGPEICRHLGYTLSEDH